MIIVPLSATVLRYDRSGKSKYIYPDVWYRMRDVKVMRFGRNGREGDGTLSLAWTMTMGVLSPTLPDFPEDYTSPLEPELHFEVFVQSSPSGLLLDLAIAAEGQEADHRLRSDEPCGQTLSSRGEDSIWD